MRIEKERKRERAGARIDRILTQAERSSQGKKAKIIGEIRGKI